MLGYTYDAVGNRLTHSHDNGTALHHDTYSYATDSHRLLGISRLTDNQPDGNRSFTYDNTGNRLTGTAEDGSIYTHTYNHANRMDSVSVDSIAMATYTYNPLGQRISKTLSNNTQEIYDYDEAGQLISVTDANGNPQREYIYFNNQPVAFIANSTIYYIHTDHLNTPQVVTDQNQQVVWMGDYQPFGKLIDNSQTNSIELYSRFPGQYLDVETGLYYNYFRDYDPSIGRYIQSDPIGLNGGINTYAYVEANPIMMFDFFGLDGSLYPKDPNYADPSDIVKSPSERCGEQCQTITVVRNFPSVASADNANFGQSLYNMGVTSLFSASVAYVTKNSMVGGLAGTGMGIYLSKNVPLIYPGDSLMETITLCKSDTDTGYTVTSRTYQIARASK